MSSDVLRCDECGEVIGVYEPTTLVLDGQPPQETSQAAQPKLTLWAREAYHLNCYELVGLAPDACAAA